MKNYRPEKKKVAILLFIVTNILLIFLLLYKSPSEEEKPNTTNEQNNDKEEIIDKKKEDKYIELDNIHTQIDFFNDDYLDRYINYKKKNKYLPVIQIVKDVNMQLDLKHYKNTVEAKQLGTEKVLVNKHYYLKEDYIPENLQKINRKYAVANMKLVDIAKEAFENMAEDAGKKNLSIIAMSTYRSYSYQKDLYNRYVKQDGKTKTDTYSGRPGHSEHQTGLSVDVYNGKEDYTNFEKTKEFTWMKNNAHKYGFILRFPKDKENETGYQYESWHYRYVGVDIATYIKEHDITFEEYYATKIKDW